MLAGRPHEAAGNGSPRWMAAGPRKRVHRTRPTGRLVRRLTSANAAAVGRSRAGREVGLAGEWRRRVVRARACREQRLILVEERRRRVLGGPVVMIGSGLERCDRHPQAVASCPMVSGSDRLSTVGHGQCTDKFRPGMVAGQRVSGAGPRFRRWAERSFNPAPRDFVAPDDALSVDMQQHPYAVARPGRYLGGVDTRVKPRRYRGVPQVVGPPRGATRSPLA